MNHPHPTVGFYIGLLLPTLACIAVGLFLFMERRDPMKYYLTDGQYLQDIREMTAEEAERANEEAEVSTGGNWWWATEPPESLVNA